MGSVKLTFKTNNQSVDALTDDDDSVHIVKRQLSRIVEKGGRGRSRVVLGKTVVMDN